MRNSVMLSIIITQLLGDIFFFYRIVGMNYIQKRSTFYNFSNFNLRLRLFFNLDLKDDFHVYFGFL